MRYVDAASEDHVCPHGLLALVFCQARSRLAAFAYLDGLLAEPSDRRSCWQLAEPAGHVTPRRMQALLAEHAWDWREALAAVQRFIPGHLGGPDAVLVIDETAELKQGEMTSVTSKQRDRSASISTRSGSGSPSTAAWCCPSAPWRCWPHPPPARKPRR
jgi:DDE superfamily endonuclease